MSMKIALDPIDSILESREEARYLLEEDGGERLADEFLRKAFNLSDSATAAGPLTTKPTKPAKPAKPAKTTKMTKMTKTTKPAKMAALETLPYAILHLEVDEFTGEPIQHSGYNGRDWCGRQGTLREYFTNTRQQPAWRHNRNPECYEEDFPYSVDNFDCEQLAADLEEDYHMERNSSVLHWALWASSLEGADAMPVAAATGATAVQRAKVVSSMRIYEVPDMLSFLYHMRTTPTTDRIKVCFIVVVSYGRLKDEMTGNTHDFVTQLSMAGMPPSPAGSDDSYALSFSERAGWMEPIESSGRDGDARPCREHCECFKCKGDELYTATRWPFLHSAGSENSETAPSLPAWTLDADSDSDSGALVRTPASVVEPTAEPAPEPEPVPQPNAVLATLDTNAAKGEAMEGDLHALIPEAAAPTEAEWRRCCTLLCLDPDAHKDARARSIRVPGADNMWVRPHQLWTAYWMLASRTERDVGGGVLADVMGTGKTYICLVVCLLRAVIGYSRAEVMREWQLREHEAKKGGHAAPKQHLARGATGDAACPCGNALGIECYANPGGETRRVADGLSRGASLVVVPATVLDHWVATVKLARLQARVVEAVVFAPKTRKEDVVLAPAPRLKQKLQMEVRAATSDGQFPAAWDGNVDDATFQYTPSTAKDAYPERFLLLATHMPERLTEFFQLAVPVRRTAGTTTRERRTVYACPVGIQLVDEWHKARAGVVTLAQQHRHMQGGGRHFDLWAVTGTPMPAAVADLETVTAVVEQLPAWEAPAHRQHKSRVAALQALQTAYTAAVAADGTTAQAAAVREAATAFFGGGLVVRHTEDAVIFGQHVFALQAVTPRVVVHVTPRAFRADVAQLAARTAARVRAVLGASTDWAQVVRSGSLFNELMELEVAGTFPGAARLLLADPPVLDLSLAAVRTAIRETASRDPADVAAFQEHYETVVADSAHLATVVALVEAMTADKTKRKMPKEAKTAKEADGKPPTGPTFPVDTALKKMVVLCPRLGEAIFVYLGLRARCPAARPVMLHADLRPAERAALLRDFDKLDAGRPTPRVLVGTFRDAGTGNDLRVASYQVLTGPLRLRSQQDQAFGRTNREGQTLPLHHRLLVMGDSAVDRIVMATQAGRRIVSDPFDLDAEVVLEE